MMLPGTVSRLVARATSNRPVMPPGTLRPYASISSETQKPRFPREKTCPFRLIHRLAPRILMARDLRMAAATPESAAQAACCCRGCRAHIQSNRPGVCAHRSDWRAGAACNPNAARCSDGARRGLPVATTPLAYSTISEPGCGGGMYASQRDADGRGDHGSPRPNPLAWNRGADPAEHGRRQQQIAQVMPPGSAISSASPASGGQAQAPPAMPADRPCAPAAATPAPDRAAPRAGPPAKPMQTPAG